MLTLRWMDNATDECGSRIERWTAVEGIPTTIAWLNATPGTGQVTYVDTGLTPGVDYYYRVFNFNQAGPSPPSNTAHGIAVTPDPVPLPQASKEAPPLGACGMIERN